MTEMVRLRLRELLAARGMSWYALAMASKGRISLTTAYRIKGSDGRAQYFDAVVLDAICETLEVEPSQLFERVHGKPKRKKRKLATSVQ